MNPDVLLAHYDRISEAPDAIPRLRQFILDLAVLGKLVEQDPSDEPASELLKRIDQVTGKTAGREVDAEDGTPFSLPYGWAWSLLGLVTSKTGSGSTPRGGQAVYKKSGIPFLRSQNIYNDGLRLNDVAYIDEVTHERMRGTAVETGDLLLNITGGSIGRCSLIVGTLIQANISQHVAIIRPAITEMGDFMHRVVLSPFFQSFVIDEQTGAGRGGLPKNRMDRIPVPIPPLAEQRRIVAKVDELMDLCDRLEETRAEREQTRNQLVAGCFQRLNQPDEDEEVFREDARFTLSHLSRMTARPEHIKQLRQTILNLAVRGKLVEQDQSDEPASDLLKKKQCEKKAGSKEKLADSNTALGVSGEEELFAIPRSWVWTRLGQVGEWGAGSTPSRSNSEFYGGEFTWLKSGELGDNQALFGSEERITKLALEKFTFRLNKPGDVLIAMYGATIGKLAILAEVAVTNQAVCGCTPAPFVSSRYLFVFLMSQREIFRGQSEGGAQPNISKVKIVSTPFALPPLAEQHRIVAKVDELMAICDQLETQLTTAESDSRRHLEAVLQRVLEVGHD